MDTPFKSLYDKMPIAAQNAAVTLFSAWLHKERYGGEYKKFQDLLNESQWFSMEELEIYQNEQLANLIHYAYAHVPYYRRIMSQRGLMPGDISSIGDLEKLPLLDKQDIRDNFSELLSDEFDIGTVRRGNTSGTTGSPLTICYDQRVVNMTYAMLDRQYRWASTKLGTFGDRVAVIRGNVIVPLTQTNPPFWRTNYLHRQLLLSSFHLSKRNLEFYIRKLREFKVQALDGYPSTLYVLARYLQSRGERFELKAVLSSSETLYDFQRDAIEDSFGCKVFDYFGSAERVLFATECDEHMGHHVAMEYGVTEIIDENGNSVVAGESGRLVSTSLHNYAMPLIRYITNDLSAWKSESCACGRRLPLMEDVTTKAEDLLTLSDGRLISPSVLTHPFKPLSSIEESQIIQHSQTEVTVKIVPGKSFSSTDEQSLTDGLKERLGAEVSINIEVVERIPRTTSGKFKWVISKVEPGI